MNLIKSTSTFGFFTLISRILGYLRDLLIAIYLGSGPIADAFFVAFRIPNTFRRLFSEGTFNAAFVPSYSSELVFGKTRSQNFANKIFNLLFISLLIIVLIIEILMPSFIFVIAPGFSGDADKLNLTISLTRIMFPFLLFVSLSSFFSAILNSHNKFAVASAAPIILNIFLILVLLFQSYLNDQLVIYLSYAVTCAGIVQLIFLLYFIRKFYFPKFTFNFKIDNKVKLFFNKLLPSIFSSGVTQINILVGTIIASFQASAVSYLYYADRIYQINLAIAGIAIGTVLLPNLSKNIQSRNKKKIDFIQNKALELSLFLSLPATIALLIASEEITSSLFGYGSFDELSVKNSAKALFYFALGLPAFSFIKIFSSFLFARHNTKVPFYFSVISVIINIIISIYYFNNIGFIIIPIATTISTWLAALIYFILLKKEKIINFENKNFINVLKILLITIPMCLFLYFGLEYFEDKFEYTNNFKLIYLLIVIGLSAGIYLFVTNLLGVLKLKSYKLDD